MGAVGWRADLTFSDRYAAITRIATAYRSSKSGASSLVAQTTAEDFEDQCFSRATSRHIYDKLIQSQVSSVQSIPLEGGALQQVEYEDEVSQLLSNGISIGPYVSAQHHKEGLFSVVYKAKSLAGCPSQKSIWKGPVVALKVSHISQEVAPHDSRREARILTQSTSSNVVPLFNSFEVKGGQFAIVMPFMPIDLGDLLRKGPLSQARGVAILKDLLGALTHIHGMGIIHRDVKPSNILLQSPGGVAVLADFGIAWWADDPSSESSDRKILDVGTTCYRPPELLFGNQRYNSSLDMWAAGCVAAQVVSLGSRTLFDSGELGSDLALVKSIFETLGTPDLTTWPEASTFPDWGKMTFHEYPPKAWTDILANSSEVAIELVSSLVRYESRSRPLASQALSHRLFAA